VAAYPDATGGPVGSGSEPPRRPGGAVEEDKPRSLAVSVGVGLILAAVVITTLVIGPTAFFVLAFTVVMMAQAEFYTVLRRTGYAPAVVLGLVSGAVLLIATYARGTPALALCVALPLPLLLVWGLTVPVQHVRTMVVSTYLGLVYGPFLIGFAVLLLRSPDGPVLTATMIGMTAVHDSGGFLFGRKIGRHRMAPHTSPKKSWEGFLAATALVCALSVAVLPFVHPFNWWLALRLALVMSVAAPFGDLAESLVKRDLGVKDMGSLIPGHGGFFDRIDAIIFNGPVAYFVLRVLDWAP
jgi:phosphatidate cytidylyltransferase